MRSGDVDDVQRPDFRRSTRQADRIPSTLADGNRCRTLERMPGAVAGQGNARKVTSEVRKGDSGMQALMEDIRYGF